MKREILFRGKRKKNGEWVYGDLIHSLGRTYCGIYAETLGEIRPETVGQFTGLIDKNGTKIFEGDIVNAGKSDFPLIVKFAVDKDKFKFATFCFECVTDRYPTYRHRLESDPDKYKVIGNIHDNPELLEGGVEECG